MRLTPAKRVLGALGLRNPTNVAYDSLADRIESLEQSLAGRSFGLQFDPEPWLVLENELRFRIEGRIDSPTGLLLRHGDYEPVETRFVLDNMPAGGTFLDVGANLGWFSLHVARSCPEATVHAFEPLPATAADFRANLEMNARCGTVRSRAVRLHEVALADAPGELFMTQQHYASNYVTRERHPGTVPVPVRTLDAVLDELGPARIDLLKVDVEGFEHPMLMGARKLLEAGNPIVLVEIIDNHPGFEHRYESKVSDIVSLFAEYGYAYGLFDDRGRFVRPQDLDGADLSWSYHNYVFARDLEPLRISGPGDGQSKAEP